MAVCWIEKVVNAHPTGTLQFRCNDQYRHPRNRDTGQVYGQNDTASIGPGKSYNFENFAVPWGAINDGVNTGPNSGQCLWASAIIDGKIASYRFDVITSEAWDWVRHANANFEEVGRVEVGTMGDLPGSNYSGWTLRLEANGAINLSRSWRQGTSRRDAIVAGAAVAAGLLLCGGMVVWGLAPLAAAIPGVGIGAAGVLAVCGGLLQMGAVATKTFWIDYLKHNPSDPVEIQVDQLNAAAQAGVREAWTHDLAAGKPAAASSQYSPEYAPSRANDGGSARTGGWSPAGEDRHAFWQVDLGAAYPLSAVSLVTRQDLDQPVTRQNFEIWASNNADMSQGHVVLASQGAEPGSFHGMFHAEVLDPTPYRYIAAVKTAEEYFFIAKLHVYGRGPDLAAGKPATASSQYSPEYSPGKANDGGPALVGGWSPSAADTGSFWQVDLGQPCAIGRIDLVTRQDLDQSATRQNFEIWGSNNPDMSQGHTVLAVQGAEPRPFKDVFSARITDPAHYRYIAAVKTAAEYFFIAKLCVYGKIDQDSWTLRMDQRLVADQSLLSANGRFKLTYQSDGNLVIIKDNQTALWSSGTYNTAPGQFVMQTDGNIVVYDASGAARWASSDHGGRIGPQYQGSRLVMQDDGNLVVYTADDAVLWASNTRG